MRRYDGRCGHGCPVSTRGRAASRCEIFWTRSSYVGIEPTARPAMTDPLDRDEPSDRVPEIVLAALRSPPRPCPRLERLVAVEATSKLLAVAAHVEACPRCSHVVRAASASAQAAPVHTERWVAMVQRAKTLFEEPTDDLIRIVAKSVRRVLELVEVVGDVLEPVPIRNRKRDGLVVQRTFDDHQLTAHLAAEADGRVTLMVDVWCGGEPSDDVRVTLLRERRELESMLPRNGRVMFGAVAPGRYRVSVAAQHRRIGVIDITIRDGS